MLDRLGEAGYKVTEPRRRVLDLLRAAKRPLTAQEAAERAGTSVASTYRVLALLVQLGAVSEVTDGAATPEDEARGKRYVLCSAIGHHHHFVCRSCHASFELACEPLERALAELEQTTGLAVEHHQFMLQGQCASCRDRDKER